MTLRLRLFLLVAGLVVLLVISQALLVRSLAARLDRDVHNVAVSVGEEILSGFVFRTEFGAEGEVETDQFYIRSPDPAGAAAVARQLDRDARTATAKESAAPAEPIESASLVPPVSPERIAPERSVETGATGATGQPPASPKEAPRATWLEHQRVEIVASVANQPPQRYFEEHVWVGSGTGAAPRSLSSSRTSPSRAPAPGGAVDSSRAPQRMKRPFVVPDGHGALLLRGPQLERRIPLPAEPIASTLDRFGSELTIGSLALLTLGLAAAAFVAHRVTRPLGRLAAAAERVGGGELGAVVAVEGTGGRDPDEIGAAIASFNAMSTRLAALDRENRAAWNQIAEREHLSELAEIARGLAHTLRNPLNALGLAVEQLAEEEDPAKASELAERSRRQIRRIDGSLRSFLALASAPGASAPEPVELGALARETALEALHDAAGRVRIEVDAPEKIEIRAVAAEVKAVVQALLVNACEASPEGGRVVVRVGRDEDGLARVEIDDEGAGVAAEIAGRLFAPHVTTKPHGSGMGLYLAQRLATHRYGGGVHLSALAPRGTRARLALCDRKGGAA